jgi:DNA-binding GntR family transcriptional regulator
VVVAPAFARALAELDFTQSFYDGAARLLGVEVGRAEQTSRPSTAARRRRAPRRAADRPAAARHPRHLPRRRPLLGLTRSHYRGDRYYLSLAVHRTEPDMSG